MIEGTAGDDADLVGTPGDDVICGLGGNDVIDGKGGTDWIFGGPGNDRLIGGAAGDSLNGGTGFDLADYISSTAAVFVTIGSGIEDDGAAGEDDSVQADVEAVRGGPKSDTLTGDGGDNVLNGGPGGGRDTLEGGGGNDTMYGGGGGDSFDGGSGSDLVSFADRATAVSVTIGTGADDGTNDGGEGDDVKTSVERVQGTLAGDELTGDAGTDELRGSGGPDTMRGGLGDDILDGDGGADTYIGGTGSDLADYQRAKTAVRVSIGGGANDGANGGAEGDTVGADMERVRGGSGNDKLYGNKRSNTLYGGPGDDQLAGGDANDTFFGGAGADVFNGGAGTDHVSYRETLGSVLVTIGSGADDGTTNGGTEGDDVQGTIEIVSGTAFGDVLRAGAGAAQLYGNAGPDILLGGPDADILVGDDGMNGGLLAGDQIAGGGGVDYIAGGKGDDVLFAREPGTLDTVDCGFGFDTFDADATDDYDADCEDGRVVAQPDTASATEDTALPIDVLANDLNLRLGDAIVTAVSQPPAGEGTTAFTASGVTYTPPADFSGGPVTFTYDTTDGLTTDTGTVFVTVNADNDAPVMGVDGALDHTEGDGKEFVDQSLTLTDVDDLNMESATVKITGGYASGEDVLDVECASCLSPVTSLTASQTGDTLTISGTGTIAEYLEALQGVRYENTSDDPSTAQRTLTYKASDGDDDSAGDTATVNVSGANDGPTDIALSDDSIAENSGSGATVGTLSATDPDDSSHTFSLLDFEDDNKFEIDGTTLKTAADFDHEVDDSYSIKVRAEDGDDIAVEVLTISVEDVDEAPAFTSSATPSAAENQSDAVDVDASDPEGATPTFSITGGADAALFSVDGMTGALTFNSAPDFESPADAGANNVYDVQVSASDGTHSSVQNVAVTVTDVNEAPGDLALDDLTVDENHPAGTPVGKASATDPDGDTLTFSLASGTGDADNAKFKFSSDPGDDPDDLALAGPLNFEGPTDADVDGDYQVRIQASDGNGHTTEKAVTVTVNDLNDTPTDVLLDPSSVPENSPTGTEVGDLSSLDEDDPPGTFAYSLVSGAGDGDNGSFELDGDTLKTKASFDFETKSTYSIRVRTTDSGGPEYEQQIQVSVTNVNEPPALGGIETADLNYLENDDKQITNDLTATEPEGDLIASATVKVSNAYNGAQDRLKFTDTATIVKDGAFDTATGTLKLKGAGDTARSAAAWQTALRAVTYENLSDTPDTTKRTFSFKVSDAGSLDSNTVTRDATVTPVNDAPTPATDTFGSSGNPATYGNTKLLVSRPDTSDPHFTLTGSSLTNDSDVDSPAGALTVDNPVSASGAKVSMATDGSFSYVPPQGFAGKDSFTYTLRDNDPTDPKTAVGTTEVWVDSEGVWYVDSAAPAAGADGRSDSPFQDLSALRGAGDKDDTGDTILLYGTGTYTGGLPLESSQSLISQAQGLSIDPAGTTQGSTALVAAAGGNPTVANAAGHGLDLATGSSVKRVNVSGTTAGIAASNVNTSDVGGSSTVTSTAGPALDVDGGSGAITVGATLTGTNSLAANIRNRTGGAGSVEVTGAATGTGIALSGNVNTHGTSFTGKVDLDATGANTALSLTGPGSFLMTNGTSTIDAASGKAVAIDGGSQLISLGSAAIKSASGLAVEVKNRTTNASTISMSGKVDGAGIAMSGNAASVVEVLKMTGDVDITTGNIGDGLSYTGNGALTISNGGSSITSTSGTAVDIGNGASAGGNDIAIAAPISTATGRLVSVQNRSGGTTTFSGSVSDTGTSTGIQVKNNSGGTVLFSGGAKEIDVSGTSQPAVDFTNNTGGTLRFTNGGLDAHNSNGPTFKATGTSTVEVSGGNNVLDSDANGPALEVSGNVSISSGGLTFRSIDSTGGVNGIKLSNTGASGGLTVTGGNTAAETTSDLDTPGSGGTISNTTSHAIDLANTDNVVIDDLDMSGPDRAGVKGTGVTNFSYTDGALSNVGDAKQSEYDAAFAFNPVSSNPGDITANRVDGTVTIKRNTVQSPYGGGLQIRNDSGTLNNVVFENNTVQSATAHADSQQDGVSLYLEGSQNAAATLTKASISDNVLRNFPNGQGVELIGSNVTSASATRTTFGDPQSSTDKVVVNNNKISGDATNKMAAFGIAASIGGRARGHVELTNNGSAGDPVRNMIGEGISAGASGDSTAKFVLTGNYVAPNNNLGNVGMSIAGNPNVATGLEVAKITATVSNNTISNTSGSGIHIKNFDSSSELKANVKNNTIAAPLQANPAIRLENGSTNDATRSPTLCVDVSGNNATGSGDANLTHAGIHLLNRRSGASGPYYPFQIVGLNQADASGTTAANFIENLNPNSSPYAPGAASFSTTSTNKRVTVNQASATFDSCPGGF